MLLNKTSTWALVACTLALGMSVRRVEAQRPERQQEVRVPGTNVTLKAGWQLLFYDGCQVAVPVSWQDDASGSLAFAPDGSSLSIRVLRTTSWSAYKAQVRAAYVRPKVVHDDSDRRLWLEIGDFPTAQHYIAVFSGARVCNGILEIRSRTMPDVEDTIKRIADSIGLAN